MVTVVVAGWVALSMVLAGLLLGAAGLLSGRTETGWLRRSADVRSRVGLHAARRRLEAAQLRTQLRADAARLRRELEQELSATHQKGDQ